MTWCRFSSQRQGNWDTERLVHLSQDRVGGCIPCLYTVCCLVWSLPKLPPLLSILNSWWTTGQIVPFVILGFQFIQFSSVTQSCPTLWDPMNHSRPGLPVHHHLQEFTQTHVHRVGDAIQPSHPLLSLSPPAPNPSQHQSLFQWVNYSHEVAKVLEFQL